MSNFKNLARRRFGKLRVQSEAGRTKRQRVIWKCLCDCGNLCEVTGTNLLEEHTLSCGCLNHALRPDAVRNCLRNRYRWTARKRSLEFSLKNADFDQLISGLCYWCGGDLSNTCTLSCHTLRYNGIDRLDNLKGYTVENCVPCCRICNHMKHILTPEEFLAHIKRILDKHSTV